MTRLPYFDIVEDFLEDSLHRVALGLCEKALSVMFGDASSPGFVPEEMARLIDSKFLELASLKPPRPNCTFVSRRRARATSIITVYFPLSPAAAAAEGVVSLEFTDEILRQARKIRWPAA